MVKRIASVIALLAFAVLLLPAAALADEGDLRVEQVQAELPDLRAYFYLEGAEPDEAEVSATLDKNNLELTSLRRYDPAQDPTDYFFLVDCSTSTTYAQMEGVKAALRGFAAGMRPTDTITLIPFGVDVQVALRDETDPATIEAAIHTLAADQPGTLFFDALAKAISLAGEPQHAMNRKLAFVFSDSADYNLGGHTKEEIDKLLAATGLPFYALGFDTGSKEELDNFGAVARASGGSIAVVSAEGVPAALDEMLSLTANALVADFKTQTNVAQSSPQEFALTDAATGKQALFDAPIRFWKPDDTAPTVTKIQQASPESLELTFSEPVQGAASPESFAVRNQNGDLLGLRAAAYDEAARAATLTFSEPPPSGELSVGCPGVTDISMEQNAVAGAAALTFEGTDPVPATPQDDGIWQAWLIIAILLAAIIIAIAVGVSRRRAKQQATAAGIAAAPGGEVEVRQPDAAPGPQVHFVATPKALPRARLDVTGPSGESRVVEVAVNGTLFVGRSDICDVYFDDPSMSRQHFVIGEEAGVFTLTNLSETGGTLLNGVPVQQPRPLQNGDLIAAGGQSILFRTLPGGEGV